MRFARRAGWPLEQSDWARQVESARSEDRVRVDLTESIPSRCGLDHAGAALAQVLAGLARDARIERYAPDPLGDPEARRAIADYLSARMAAVEPGHVALTAGTSEGYAHLFRLLADAGDRVLVPRPGYPLFDFIAELEGLEPVPYPLVFEEGARAWRVDLAGVRDALDERTRTLVVVHPANPTGSLVHPEDAAALRALCRERGIALIADEVFGDYLFDEAAKPKSWLASPDAAPLEFALSGASKMLALPQLKLAWIAVGGLASDRRAEALARLEVITDTYLSVSPLAAYAVSELLARRTELQAPVLARVRANHARLLEAVAGSGLEVRAADGGWAAVLHGDLDDEDRATRLLDRDGVLVQPGYLFDLPTGHLVVSLLVEPASLEQGIAALLASER
jgi:hypothetical protein